MVLGKSRRSNLREMTFLNSQFFETRNLTRVHLFWVSVFFVCLWYFNNFSLIWRRHHYRSRAANFYLCSSLMAIEQGGLFSVPHLLWHEVSIYNVQLRGPATLTPIAECLAVELWLPGLTNWVCRGLDSNTQPSVCRTG